VVKRKNRKPDLKLVRLRLKPLKLKVRTR